MGYLASGYGVEVAFGGYVGAEYEVLSGSGSEVWLDALHATAHWGVLDGLIGNGGVNSF